MLMRQAALLRELPQHIKEGQLTVAFSEREAKFLPHRI
jgi:hypothetical protein